MFQARRIFDFRQPWGGSVISALGTWLLVLAIPPHVHLHTGPLRDTILTLTPQHQPRLALWLVPGSPLHPKERRGASRARADRLSTPGVGTLSPCARPAVRHGRPARASGRGSRHPANARPAIAAVVCGLAEGAHVLRGEPVARALLTVTVIFLA